MITAGCIGCFSAAELINEKAPVRNKNPLVFIGQNTLAFYMLGGYVRKAFGVGMEAVHLYIPSGPVCWTVNTAVICIGCVLISLTVNRFAPFLVGKGRYSRTV